MTRKISERVRDELLSMNSDERRDKRCMVVKRLTAECKKLTSEKDKEIDERAATINTLERSQAEVRKERTAIIKKHRMTGVMNRTNYTDGCELDKQHPELLKFDAETNKQRKEILLM